MGAAFFYGLTQLGCQRGRTPQIPASQHPSGHQQRQCAAVNGRFHGLGFVFFQGVEGSVGGQDFRLLLAQHGFLCFIFQRQKGGERRHDARPLPLRHARGWPQGLDDEKLAIAQRQQQCHRPGVHQKYPFWIAKALHEMRPCWVRGGKKYRRWDWFQPNATISRFTYQ